MKLPLPCPKYVPLEDRLYVLSVIHCAEQNVGYADFAHNRSELFASSLTNLLHYEMIELVDTTEYRDRYILTDLGRQELFTERL